MEKEQNNGGEYFEVTREWIHRHSTNAGGWTRTALAILGVAWPPPSGWQQRSVGKLITHPERRLFEAQGRQRPSARLPF